MRSQRSPRGMARGGWRLGEPGPRERSRELRPRVVKRTRTISRRRSGATCAAYGDCRCGRARPRGCGRGVVEQWLDQYDQRRGRSRTQEALRAAIATVAIRVPEDAAANLVVRFIQQHDLAQGDQRVQDAWLSAIEACASRIPEGAAGNLVAQWFEEYDPCARMTGGILHGFRRLRRQRRGCGRMPLLISSPN